MTLVTICTDDMLALLIVLERAANDETVSPGVRRHLNTLVDFLREAWEGRDDESFIIEIGD